MLQRPPIIVVLGHVDHGKTTLLDYIRKTNVAERETGGITQSIGAYEIVHNGKKITFIDTPGHEAFSKMREHGVKIADLAILVVAADEGVKSQTRDALKYILKEKMPYVVAINKIDKRNADIERTKKELGEAGVLLEGMGGNISYELVSAKTGEGVDKLLDLILLAAEIENLSFNPEGPARGVILSVHPDPQRGLSVGVIITDGTLRKGEEVYTASAYGKIKLLENFLGEEVLELSPSAPAMILGFLNSPQIGEKFSHEPIKIPKMPAIKRKTGQEKTVEGGEPALKVILKANEAGSLEALFHVTEKVSEKRRIAVVEKSLGNIHESDVKLAASTGAVILGFKVKADKAAENTAKMQDLDLFLSDVIYELEKKLEEYIESNQKEELRTIEILAVFSKLKGGRQIVGGRVFSGPIKNQESFEVLEGKKSIGSGKIVNLQSEKVDIASAETGKEVGLLVETNVEIKAGHKLAFGNK